MSFSFGQWLRMLQLSLASVIPNETSPSPKVLQLPVPEKPAVETSMQQLLDALEGADRLFQDAYRLARTTRGREQELQARLEKAEADLKRQTEQAQDWQSRYEVLEAKIPWWVRKLCGAPKA